MSRLGVPAGVESNEPSATARSYAPAIDTGGRTTPVGR